MPNRPSGAVSSGWSWGAAGSVGVGVAQPEGCGRPGHHITLDPDVVLELAEAEVDTLGESSGWKAPGPYHGFIVFILDVQYFVYFL